MAAARLQRIAPAAFGLVLCLSLLSPGCAWGATPWLHTDGNRIKDPAGNVVVLRGVGLPDLGATERWYGGATAMIDRLTDTNDAQASSPGWYPRIVRLAIYPADQAEFTSPFTFTPGNDDFYVKLLRPVVDYCRSKGLYVIIDWHYVGQDTSAKSAQTKQFWQYMAPRFAGDSHVMFELFNEPLNTSPGSEAADWLSVRADMQAWIDAIRVSAPDNLIMIAGPSWSQIIGPAADYPLTGGNLVMVSHIYPVHWTGWNPPWYKGQIDHCLTRYPVFMTEWGFGQNADAGLAGTISGYGQTLADYREQNKIGATAWVASYDWLPSMFSPGWVLRTGENEMGGYVKDTLYLRRNDDRPQGSSVATQPLATSVSIRTSAATVVRGRQFVLSGACTPTPALIGSLIQVDVRKPGKAYWSASSRRAIYRGTAGEAWWYYRYTTTARMAKGSYRFRAVFAATAAYRGSSSAALTVGVR